MVDVCTTPLPLCSVFSFHDRIPLPFRNAADPFHVAFGLILHHDNRKVACEYARRPNKAIQLAHQSLAPKTLLHHATTPQSYRLLDTITYSLSKPRSSLQLCLLSTIPQHSVIGSYTLSRLPFFCISHIVTSFKPTVTLYTNQPTT